MIYNLIQFNCDKAFYAEGDYRRLRELLNAYVQRVPHLKRLFV